MKTILIVLTAVLLTACGGGDSSSGGGGGFLGTYQGTTKSTVDPSFTSPLTVIIESDDGQNIAGRVQVPNSPCFTNASFAGTRQPNGSINGAAVNGPNVLTMTMNHNGREIRGQYQVAQGACIGDRGTYAAVR